MTSLFISRALLWSLFFTFCIQPPIIANSTASVITPINLPPSIVDGGIILLQPSEEYQKSTFSRLDIYGDLLCPDYREFVESVESKIVEKYKNANLLVVLHLFPLPYHHVAYVINQAALGLALHHTRNFGGKSGEIFSLFRNAVFNVQESFGNAAIINTTMLEITKRVGDVAATAGLSRKVAMASISDRSIDLKLRSVLKAAWSRGVTGSPSLYLNSVPLYLAGTDTWTERLLSGVIDSCHIRAHIVDFV